MAIYECGVCGFIFDEAKEGKGFQELEVCPVCKVGAGKFTKISDGGGVAEATEPVPV